MDPDPKFIVSNCCHAGIKMVQKAKCRATCKSCGNGCRPLSVEYVERKEAEKEARHKEKEDAEKKKKGIW